MNSAKQIISNFQKQDYFSKVNLHIHTNCSDGKMQPIEVIEKAQAKGLEYISITDHNTIDAYNHIDFNEIKDLTLITGVEFDCWYKSNFMHILGYGFDLNNQDLHNLCAKTKKETELDIVRIFSSKKAPDVIKTIKNAGGIAVLAHPACCWNLNLNKMVKELVSYGLDGIELYYPYVRHRGILKFHSIKEIEKISKTFQLLTSGGTDCHDSDFGS